MRETGKSSALTCGMEWGVECIGGAGDSRVGGFGHRLLPCWDLGLGHAVNSVLVRNTDSGVRLPWLESCRALY